MPIDEAIKGGRELLDLGLSISGKNLSGKKQKAPEKCLMPNNQSFL